MEYTSIKTSVEGRVGVITLCHPPRNAFSKRMMFEILDVLDQFEKDDNIRVVMMNAEGKNFSQGADGGDINASLTGQRVIKESFSELGSRLVERIDNYDKATIVAARGGCVGGSTAIFNSFDIRIVSESFTIHDGDIYYGTVGSWGMSSLRLPIWIGRNKMMDYMFLNEDFNARQAYELGIVSKVVSDDVLDESSMKIAQKMAIAAPLAVKAFKECVREAIYGTFQQARAKELEVADFIMKTEDSKNGLAAVIKGEQAEFFGK